MRFLRRERSDEGHRRSLAIDWWHLYPGELFDGWGPHETVRTFEECQRDIMEVNEELTDVKLECILVDGGQ